MLYHAIQARRSLHLECIARQKSALNLDLCSDISVEKVAILFLHGRLLQFLTVRDPIPGSKNGPRTFGNDWADSFDTKPRPIMISRVDLYFLSYMRLLQCTVRLT